MTAPVFEARDVVKLFGSFRAVDGVSIRIVPGEVYGIAGPSGAGKTTLMRMLCGLTPSSGGEARLLDQRMPGGRRQVESRLGYMPQERAVYRDLSVAENLLFFGRIYGMTRQRIGDRTQELLSLMHLERSRGQRADRLSGGEKQRLSLACALVHEPGALLLDEPTIGLDPALREEFWQYFHTLNGQGRTILLSTHYLHEAAKCSRVGLMRRGRLVAEGTPHELTVQAANVSGESDPDMERVFLILTAQPEGGAQ